MAGRTISGTLAANLATTTSTAVIPAQGASFRTVLTVLQVSNSHATVDTVVNILDGTTVKWRANAKAAGGGYVVTFPGDGLVGSKNTAWNVQCETTGSAIQCSLAGFVDYDGG